MPAIIDDFALSLTMVAVLPFAFFAAAGQLPPRVLGPPLPAARARGVPVTR